MIFKDNVSMLAVRLDNSYYYYFFFQTQLRNRLALELQNKFVVHSKDNIKSPKDNSLFLEVSNSLVLDHLKRCSYDYTLSVFITESLISPEKVCTFCNF